MITTDAIGNVINIGDYIFFPEQNGNTVRTQIGKITKFNFNDEGKLSSVIVNSASIGFDKKPENNYNTRMVRKLTNFIKVKPDNLTKPFLEVLN